MVNEEPYLHTIVHWGGRAVRDKYANVPCHPFNSILPPEEKDSCYVKNDVSSNSPWTNAGMGSNLTVSETVECNASIMDGHTLQYGAVGAVQGVKNPILLAKSLLGTQ